MTPSERSKSARADWNVRLTGRRQFDTSAVAVIVGIAGEIRLDLFHLGNRISDLCFRQSWRARGELLLEIVDLCLKRGLCCRLHSLCIAVLLLRRVYRALETGDFIFEVVVEFSCSLHDNL